MGKGVNKVTLLGNLGRDPEVKVANGGVTVATFSLATPERKKDASGNWMDYAEWHNCVAFGKTAEVIRDYVRKGSKLYLEGKLQTRSWDDRESGQKRYKTEVVVFEVTLLGGRREGGSVSDADDSVQPGCGYTRAETAITDDDIPF